jgi:hypothetical protein
VVYTAPDDESEPDTATITVTSATGTQSVQVEIQKVKIRSIATSNAQGDTGGRLNPDGGTSFVITGKKDFPLVPLRVIFRHGDLSVPVDIPVGNISGPTITGVAPPNTQFVGDAEVLVFADGGATKISKKTLCDDTGGSAYYSFDRPSPATSISVPGFNRLGGNLTITTNVGGYRRFDSTVPGVPPENPKVQIGGQDGIGFAVNTVTPTTINGNVQRADASIQSCARQGQVPCLNIVVRNPGGRSQDKVPSNVPLYNLLPGPPPMPQSRVPDRGFSVGGTVVTIRGENLDFTDNVTIGGTDAPIISKTDRTLVVSTLPHAAGGGNAILLFDIDNAAPGGTAVPGGIFRFDLTPVTGIPTQDVYIVGPGEGVDVPENKATPSSNINCITDVLVNVIAIPPPPGVLPGVQTFLVRGSYNCAGCTCSAQTPPLNCPRTVSGTISFTLRNTAAVNDTSLRRNVNRTANVRFEPPAPPGLPRTCNGSF